MALALACALDARAPSLRRHLERTFEAQCAQLAPGVLDRNLRDWVDRAA